MKQVYNFSAGPACINEEVLNTAAREMTNYANTGMSVMEMSHRSKEYEAIIARTEADMRELMNIPEGYKVLFMQGGASLQFLTVPMNLMKTHKKAAYVNTGMWSKKAIKEAKSVGEVEVVASSEDKTFSYIPDIPQNITGVDYLHITSNNTIYGTKISKLPKTDVPIVTDMSSCIMSSEINVSDYGIIYAGAQKNLGPAGVCVVIIREDLIGLNSGIPSYLDYKTHADNDSMFNTPPTYSIYIMGLVFKWLKGLGGIAAIEKTNMDKANMLYDYLDESKMFSATVMNKDDRSIMNIPFVTGDETLDAKFISEAKTAGFVNLKGHRSVGGMRASIYNAMPVRAIAQLLDFMNEFERNNGNV